MDQDCLNEVKVLVVEDDDDDWLITKKIFDKIDDSPFHVERSSTYDDAITQVDADEHDIYLIDYRLGEHTGTDILEHAHPEDRSQPFILMTGLSDSTLALKSLRLAAADYLVKGSFDAQRLYRTLLYALQRKRLEQQRIDQLTELNQAKEEFISIASHQLRTPATSVKQYLGMVLEGFVGDVPQSQRPMLRQAYESNERQLRIISDLLKVAQIDSGKLKLRHRSTDITALMRDIVAEESQITRGRNQTIKFMPLKAPLKLELDADIFRMVFENLIDNASKYSHDSSVIRVEMSDLGEEVCIGIIDQGVGINPDELHRLYEKFARIDNPLSTKVGGSGLGLYWAKRIIDLHGGRIEYRSNRPNGSKFLVCLPKHLHENVK